MNIKQTFFCIFFTTVTVWGSPAVWTSSDGREATMTLVRVTELDGKLTGMFRMLNGQTATLPEEKLAASEKPRLQAKLDEQKAKLAEEQDKKEAEERAELDKVFPVIKNKVEVGAGTRMKSLKDFQPPEKYYLFYSTASWCGPCQKFTPSLVEFYNKYQKTHGDIFEVILLSSDRTEEAQAQYTKSKKMEWPQLAMDDARKLKDKFNIKSPGIPSLTLTDNEGNILLSHTEGYTNVMNKFGKMLDAE